MNSIRFNYSFYKKIYVLFKQNSSLLSEGIDWIRIISSGNNINDNLLFILKELKTSFGRSFDYPIFYSTNYMRRYIIFPYQTANGTSYLFKGYFKGIGYLSLFRIEYNWKNPLNNNYDFLCDIYGLSFMLDQFKKVNIRKDIFSLFKGEIQITRFDYRYDFISTVYISTLLKRLCIIGKHINGVYCSGNNSYFSYNIWVKNGKDKQGRQKYKRNPKIGVRIYNKTAELLGLTLKNNLNYKHIYPQDYFNKEIIRLEYSFGSKLLKRFGLIRDINYLKNLVIERFIYN